MRLPDGVLGMASRGPDWARWVDCLPQRLAGLLEEWALTPDGWSMHGYCSIVVPVRTQDAQSAVLKVVFDGDEESQHEHLVLQHWSGRGAARLLRADPHRRAMLLERLHHEDLTTVPDLEACEVVAALYPRLHLPALPQLLTVTSYVERWSDALASMPRNAPIPRRMVEQALSLARELMADPSSTGVIVHGDLHYLNVLASDREPWLVIDPKPMSGDPHFELAPMLWNRMEELGTAVRTGVRRRFHTLVDAAGLDEARARDWVIVRMVLNAHWAVQDAQRGDRDLSADERDWITSCIAIVKAVQD
jgi:streptomycin 6-kinase